MAATLTLRCIGSRARTKKESGVFFFPAFYLEPPAENSEPD